jgi:hypothetical protein
MMPIIQNYQDYLTEIKNLFADYYIRYQNGNEIFAEIIKRGYAVPINVNIDNIKVLICGINPSYPDKKDRYEEIKYPAFKQSITDKHPYWSNMRNNIITGIPINCVESIDLFSLRESNQNFLKNKCFNNPDLLRFLIVNLWLTQQLIEIISPKLIIVANKGQWGYWGVLDNIYWMGYKFKKEPVKVYSEKMQLLEIEGLKDTIYENGLFKNGPIGKIESNFETRLSGTKVLFTLFQTGRHKCQESERIKPGMISDILTNYC